MSGVVSKIFKSLDECYMCPASDVPYKPSEGQKELTQLHKKNDEAHTKLCKVRAEVSSEMTRIETKRAMKQLKHLKTINEGSSGEARLKRQEGKLYKKRAKARESLKGGPEGIMDANSKTDYIDKDIGKVFIKRASKQKDKLKRIKAKKINEGSGGIRKLIRKTTSKKNSKSKVKELENRIYLKDKDGLERGLDKSSSKKVNEGSAGIKRLRRKSKSEGHSKENMGRNMDSTMRKLGSKLKDSKERKKKGIEALSSKDKKSVAKTFRGLQAAESKKASRQQEKGNVEAGAPLQTQDKSYKANRRGKPLNLTHRK